MQIIVRLIFLVNLLGLLTFSGCTQNSDQEGIVSESGSSSQINNNQDQWVFVPSGNGQTYLLEITEDFTADFQAFSGYASDEQDLTEVETLLKEHPLVIKRGQKLPVDAGVMTRWGNTIYRFNGKEYAVKIPFRACKLLWRCDNDLWISLSRSATKEEPESEFPRFETLVGLLGASSDQVVKTPSYATATFELLAKRKANDRTDYLIVFKDTPEACMAPGTFQLLAVQGKTIKLLKLYDVMSDAGVFAQSVRHKIINSQMWEFEHYVEKGDEYDPEKSSTEVLTKQFIGWSEGDGFSIVKGK